MSHRTYTANSWPNMVELYRSDVEGSVNKVFAPMLVLVEQIASSRYTL
jgi:hypothetical protein